MKIKYDKIRKIILNEKFNKIILCALFGIYLIISFLIMIKHEIWTDEAQAWIISKDLNYVDIFRQMKYEGHSCLWILILSIFSKSGFPVITLNIISWILVSIAVCFILFKSNFNLIIKIIIIFNPAFIFYLSAISRCYSLIPLLLCLFVYFYPKRHKKPYLYTNILGLIAHTHIIMCGFVAVASILFIVENFKKLKEDKIQKKQLIKILTILFIYFILLVVQVFPAIFNCDILRYKPLSGKEKIDFESYMILRYFFSFEQNKLCTVIFLFAVVILFIITFLYEKKKGIIFIFTIFVFYIIHIFWPFILSERISILFVVLFILNFNNTSKIFKILITIISILIFVNHYNYVKYDYYYSYSESKNTAKFIDESIEDNSLIILLSSDYHVSMIAYVKNQTINYYNFKLKSFQRYITWNKNNSKIINYNELLRKIKYFKNNYDNIYILATWTDTSISFDVKENIKKLQKNKIIKNVYFPEETCLDVEKFYIYKVKSNKK